MRSSVAATSPFSTVTKHDVGSLSTDAVVGDASTVVVELVCADSFSSNASSGIHTPTAMMVPSRMSAPDCPSRNSNPRNEADWASRARGVSPARPKTFANHAVDAKECHGQTDREHHR